MAWTNPLTAVANSPLSAAEWNAHVRDNLNETAPGKTMTPHSFIASINGGLDLSEAPVEYNEVLESGLSNAEGYVDLPGTFGPSVTVRNNGSVIIFIFSYMTGDTSPSIQFMGIDASDFNGEQATDRAAIYVTCKIAADADDPGHEMCFGGAFYFVGEPGVATFTAKYRTTNGFGFYKNRSMIAIPL